MPTLAQEHDGGLTGPQHVAIIMDGNGRWAGARGLPRAAGHKAGAHAVRRTIKAAVENGVPYLTLFGFSSENWKRPETEVSELMGLLRFYLRKETAELDAEGVRIKVIGERSRLPKDVVNLINGAEDRTRDNRRLTLTVALSYGGRQEIAQAARVLAERAKAGELDPSDIDEAAFESALATADLPEPDLLIRTSGEQRISNFLLWQLAYAELVFIDRLWPDFDATDFIQAISEFRGRERRFGGAAAV